MKTNPLGCLLLLLVLTALPPIAAAQATRNSVPASEVNGTFRRNFTGKFKDASSDIEIWALGGGRLRVGMELVFPMMVNGELSANMGDLDGEARIVGDTATYESKENGPCKITIKFTRPGVIDVSQEGSDADCGFGHNVTANGTYKKVSSTKPKFDTH